MKASPFFLLFPSGENLETFQCLRQRSWKPESGLHVILKVPPSRSHYLLLPQSGELEICLGWVVFPFHGLPKMLETWSKGMELPLERLSFPGCPGKRRNALCLACYFPHCRGKLPIAHFFLRALALSDSEDLGVLGALGDN